MMYEAQGNSGISEEFRSAKELFVKWLKKVPAEQFPGLESAGRRYSERYAKICFLTEIRSAQHSHDLGRSLLRLDGSEDIIALFLCSRLSLKHWRSTRGLIDGVVDPQIADTLAKIYTDRLDLRFSRIPVRFNGTWYQGLTFQRVSPNQRLRVPECRLF